MNVKIEDLMVTSVVTTHKHQTVRQAKDIMQRNGIHSLPIVTENNEVEGIITTKDLVEDISDDTQIRHIMTTKILSIPKYSDVHIAARIMRNHHIHHLVVTHEKQIVGVLSAFDLLKLIEKHRYIAKNAPTPNKKARKKQF